MVHPDHSIQINKKAYSEFLAPLLTGETEMRNMRKLKRPLSQSGMGTEKRLESFDFSFNPSINAAYVRKLATCRFIERGKGIFFIGLSGKGKTHLAKAFCHQTCRNYFTVAFYPFHQFFKGLQKAKLKGQLSKTLKDSSPLTSW